MIMRNVKAILLAEKDSTVRGLPLDLPVSLIDVLGSSILQRTIDYLRGNGIEDITVITDFDQQQAVSLNGTAIHHASIVESKDDIFSGAEEAYRSAAQGSAAHILLLRVNAYLEANLQQLLSHHTHFHNRVTRVWCGSEPLPLDVFLINASRWEDGIQLIRNGMRECPGEGVGYRLTSEEYVNCLRDARELRQLAADALHLRCQLQPVGEQIRPGIWVGEGSRIAGDARLVAPIYVGKRVKVRTGAVVTRGSSIEHHCSVDCGTVVENATLLPYSQIGPCLDLSNVIAGERHIVHLKRNVVTEIHDGRLLSAMSASPLMRALTVAGSLLSFLPEHFCRGLFSKSPKPAERVMPVNGFGTTHARNSSSKDKADLPEMAAGLAVVRRYGNQ